MKTFTKFCLILSGILIVLGLGGVGVSLAMGLTPSQLLNLASYPGNLRSLPQLEKLDELEDPLEEIPGLLGKSDDWGEEHYEWDKDSISGLEFDLSLCELDIRSHDEDLIILETKNGKNTFQCSTDDGVLVLEDDRKAPITGRSMDNALRLRLYLPEKVFRDVEIDLGVGDISIDRLSFDDFDLDIGVGDLKITELEGKELSLELGVTDCRIDSLSLSESCSIDAATCDLTLGRYKGPDLVLDCAAGDVSLTAEGREEDYNYTLDCGVGDIQINRRHPDACHSHEGHGHGGLGCHINANRQARQTMDIQCAAGDLNLYFTEED